MDWENGNPELCAVILFSEKSLALEFLDSEDMFRWIQALEQSSRISLIGKPTTRAKFLWERTFLLSLKVAFERRINVIDLWHELVSSAPAE